MQATPPDPIVHIVQGIVALLSGARRSWSAGLGVGTCRRLWGAILPLARSCHCRHQQGRFGRSSSARRVPAGRSALAPSEAGTHRWASMTSRHSHPRGHRVQAALPRASPPAGRSSPSSATWLAAIRTAPLSLLQAQGFSTPRTYPLTSSFRLPSKVWWYNTLIFLPRHSYNNTSKGTQATLPRPSESPWKGRWSSH
jgi:hypothetical protein